MLELVVLVCLVIVLLFILSPDARKELLSTDVDVIGRRDRRKEFARRTKLRRRQFADSISSDEEDQVQSAPVPLQDVLNELNQSQSVHQRSSRFNE